MLTLLKMWFKTFISILLKSALKMQEMPFQRPKPPYKCVRSPFQNVTYFASPNKHFLIRLYIETIYLHYSQCKIDSSSKNIFFGVQLQISSFQHYNDGLAYTVCLLFKCILGLRNISKDNNEVFLRVTNHTGQAEKNLLGPAGIRTRDLRFTSPMLYQLSYRSSWELVAKWSYLGYLIFRNRI